MQRKINILVHPVFLAGLFVLALNDHVLKQQYHNIITGKLSDFAGLFIFPFFWAALLPKYRKAIYIITALGFIYWKSSWSQPLLDRMQVWQVPVMRVVDYTDLIALCLLPVSYRFFNTAKMRDSRRMLIAPVAVISFVAFCATSPPWYFMPADAQWTYYKAFKTRLSKTEVLAQLDSLGFEYSIDTGYYSSVHGRGDTKIEGHIHDSECLAQEYWTVKNINYNNDTLDKVFISYKKGKKYNYIQLYGYNWTRRDWHALSGKIQKRVPIIYYEMVRDGLIEEIKE